jgi:pimeloyl-ACP methyl ester carboxylesterase
VRPKSDGYARGWEGVPIRYAVHGKGEPALVCCNGLGVSTFFWKYILDYFSRCRRVVTWEYRGHYSSGKPDPVAPAKFTVTANARDLAAVLDACDVRHAVVLGHSMGCQVLLEFWKRYPDRVVGLIPICGAYGRPIDTFLGLPEVSHVLFDALYAVTAVNPRAVEAVLRPLLRSRIPYEVARLGLINAQLAGFDDMRPYFEHLAKMDLQVFFMMAREMQRHDAGPWLHAINVPALVVAGESDLMTPLPLALKMRDKIPDAELLLLPKGSHAGIIEHPELLNLRIEKFLRERVEPFLAMKSPVQGNPHPTRGRRRRSARHPRAGA